jgi:hypothetical protein
VARRRVIPAAISGFELNYGGRARRVHSEP